MSYKTLPTLYPFICRSGPGTEIDGKITDTVLKGMFDSSLEQGTTGCYSNGTFTAPIDGLYSFEYMLCAQNQSGTGMNSMTFGFDISKSLAFSSRKTSACPDNATDTTELQYWIRTIVNLDVGNTVTVRIYDEGVAEKYEVDKSHYIAYLITAFT